MRAALVGIAAAATAVGVAAPAHADGVRGDEDVAIYRAELNREGIAPMPLSQAGEIATEICQALHDGQTARQLVAKGMSSGLTANQAAIEVVGAEFHFCGPDGRS
jgi:hypothetical protein